MKVRLLSPARADMADVIAYYLDESPESARAWLDDLEELCELLESNPRLGRPVDGENRRINLAGFPYYLIYRITVEVVEVSSIVHSARHPDTWTGRVNEDPAPYGKEAITMEPTAPNLKEALYQAGLCLPEEERIALGEKLIRSVEPDDLSPEWKAELDRRSDAVKEGTMACITLEELKLKYGRA